MDGGSTMMAERVRRGQQSECRPCRPLMMAGEKLMVINISQFMYALAAVSLHTDATWRVASVTVDNQRQRSARLEPEIANR